MTEKPIAKVSTTIKAPASKVWEALTQPEQIKQYLFGTNVETDWKVGSPIRYRGEWEGKPYEDKGQITKVVPGKVLESTYWSPLSGVPDRPEYYKNVRYELSEADGGTRVTVLQDNNDSQEEAQHLEQNWAMVLDGLKKWVEGNGSGG